MLICFVEGTINGTDVALSEVSASLATHADGDHGDHPPAMVGHLPPTTPASYSQVRTLGSHILIKLRKICNVVREWSAWHYFVV